MAVSLEDRVRDHSDFFDKLVELIPAKYYVPDEADPEWSKFKKTKSAKAAAKQEAKENSKKALRAKLQPGNAMTTLEKMRAAELGVKKGGAGKEDEDEEEEEEEEEEDFEDDVSDEDDEEGDESEEDDEDESESESEDDEPAKKKGKEGGGGGGGAGVAAAAPTTPAGAPPTSGWSLGESESGVNKMEDLRARLKAKIEASRVARKAEESQEKIAKAREWREEKKKTKKAEKKRKQRAEAAVGDVLDGKVGGNKKSKKGGGLSEDSSAGGAAGAGGKCKDTTGDDSLQFGRIEVDGKITGRSKQKRASKEVLLKRALDQRAEIEAAGGEDTAAGKKVAEKYSWDAALSRAGGEKVLDDPKLLQKSVKNEARAKKKSQEKWAKRIAFTEEQMAAKQKKRKDSLKSRADAKIEKRIEKREKKRNRPGFEGRSQGPINP